MKKLNAMLMCDFYKIAHRTMYPDKTELVYSTWIPRTSRMNCNEVVVFGIQSFVKLYLIDFFNDNFFNRNEEEIVEEYSRIIKNTLGEQTPDVQHIRDLHKLGYLPLRMRALPEGSVIPLRVPMMTVENTNPKFFWLTNFIESLASCELWQSATSATIAREYKKILDFWAIKTVGNTEFVKFQGHDFSMRGMSSLNSAISSGMGHLTSFVGTDNIPAIQGAEEVYGADVEKELVGTSIPATEHSVQCAYEDDLEYLRNIITKVHPKGFVSIVSDGYDFWDVIGRVIPLLKTEILNRKGGTIGDRVVIRPDSGNPVKIVCGDSEGETEIERKGAIEALWDIFGGTVSENGYKVLDSHIGLIYGDAITLERCNEICRQLEAKGFASVNCVFGIGSYTYQYNTRDTFGFALKSTLCVIDGVEKQIFKTPKTDNGVKNSLKGRVIVVEENGKYKYIDGIGLKEHRPENCLKDVFSNGKLCNEQTLSEIRTRIIKYSEGK